ncbi:cysteine-rich CWC family protein [Shewanella xiamenensis]|uniref:Cysteine-rich CWC family protein n=1 Tax=Shewanella xiamenensis TaxID=332186 RepID=A0ABT6UEV5_9GAMM|nr:cysteine-rich CWC family protein [Shewanella xiamenensis]MDI5833014.1 cysteine-rich CWC family protein [Shewanella xiamenensis]
MPKDLPEPQFNAAQLCPLCQGANQCAMTLGAEISDCWCAKQRFPYLTQLLSGDLAAGLSTGDASGLSADKLAQLLSQPEKDRTGITLSGFTASTAVIGVHHPLGVAAGHLRSLRERGMDAEIASVESGTSV